MEINFFGDSWLVFSDLEFSCKNTRWINWIKLKGDPERNLYFVVFKTVACNNWCLLEIGQKKWSTCSTDNETSLRNILKALFTAVTIYKIPKAP